MVLNWKLKLVEKYPNTRTNTIKKGSIYVHKYFALPDDVHFHRRVCLLSINHILMINSWHHSAVPKLYILARKCVYSTYLCLDCTYIRCICPTHTKKDQNRGWVVRKRCCWQLIDEVMVLIDFFSLNLSNVWNLFDL